MINNKKLTAILPVILFLIVAMLILGVIGILPYDKPSTTSANSFGNLLNGGYVADDGSMTYYVDGSGVLRCSSDPKVYYVDKDCDSICPYRSGVIYRTKSGTIKYSAYNGSSKQTLVKSGVKQMTVNGNWIYYSNSERELCKLYIRSREITNTHLKVNQFSISGTAVLYIADDGRLYTARTDGNDTEPFLGEKVDCFMRYNSYIFYKQDGKLYSVASGNTANKQTYMEVDEFNINDDGILFYTDDSGLHYRDITKEKIKDYDIPVAGGITRNLNVLGDRVYFYNDRNQLVSCLKDGSDLKSY